MNTAFTPKWLSGNTQQKLELLNKHYGCVQQVKVPPYGQFTMTLKKETNLTGDLSYWVLIYNPNNELHLYSLKIMFFDTITYEYNNNAILTDLFRTDEHSGTILMKVAITISRYLGVHELKLVDAASINGRAGAMVDSCNVVSLSFYKLLEKGVTFYERFGFLPTNASAHYLLYAKTPAAQHTFIKVQLAAIKKIFVGELREILISIMRFLFDSLLSVDCKIIKCELDYMYSKSITKIPISLSQVSNFIREFAIILQHLNRYVESDMLLDILIDSFNKDINTYIDFLTILVHSNIYYFETCFGEKSRSLKLITPLRLLDIARSVQWVKQICKPNRARVSHEP